MGWNSSWSRARPLNNIDQIDMIICSITFFLFSRTDRGTHQWQEWNDVQEWILFNMFELSSNQQVNSIVSKHRKKENDWISGSEEKPKKEKTRNELRTAGNSRWFDSNRLQALGLLLCVLYSLRLHFSYLGWYDCNAIFRHDGGGLASWIFVQIKFNLYNESTTSVPIFVDFFWFWKINQERFALSLTLTSSCCRAMM